MTEKIEVIKTKYRVFKEYSIKRFSHKYLKESPLSWNILKKIIIFFFTIISSSVGEEIKIPKYDWSFKGITGKFDRTSLQRGYQVYTEVCASCHSMNLLSYRNLGEKGGPEFSVEQVKAIAAGQGDVAIVNSYYIGLLLSSEKEEELAAGNAVSVFFPNQGENESGSHINISGIGLAKHAPNKANAIKLMEYLTSEDAQKVYVNNSFEYPVNSMVEPSEIVKNWGEFRPDSLDLNLLGKYRNDAILVFDKTGWK